MVRSLGCVRILADFGSWFLLLWLAIFVLLVFVIVVFGTGDFLSPSASAVVDGIVARGKYYYSAVQIDLVDR